MGYSVLLWNIPEKGLQDGDVVPVYIRSNISHVYVIGTSEGKFEVPLWQLTEPVSKSKVNKLKNRYADYSHKYATVALDGLPMRAEAVNTAKQVYRLRKNETVKLLYKVKGQAPMTGGKPLEGEWLKILTSDGTSGCCFSYNLRPFETDATGRRIGGEIQEETVVKAMDRAEAQTRVFVFYALSDVISFANAAFGEKKMGSKLYKLNDLYYLVLMKKRISQKDFDKLSCQAVEFADPIRYGFKQVDYLEEHGECLIPAQAIGKLKKIG